MPENNKTSLSQKTIISLQKAQKITKCKLLLLHNICHFGSQVCIFFHNPFLHLSDAQKATNIQRALKNTETSNAMCIDSVQCTALKLKHS